MARDLTSFRPTWHAGMAPAYGWPRRFYRSAERSIAGQFTDLRRQRPQRPVEVGVADRAEHAVVERAGELGDADGRVAEAAVGGILRRCRVDVEVDRPAG